MTSVPVVVEQTFSCDIDRLWRALTHPEEMSRWFFEPIATFQPEVGFHTAFLVEADGKPYVHEWTVVEASPPGPEGAVIAYRWSYRNIEGEALARFDATTRDGATALKVVFDGLHTFPDDDPVFSREACVGGWRYFIQESLVAYLADS